MYAAVQLSSQQQQMYVANNNDTKRNTINKISKIYQIVFPPFDLHIAAAAAFFRHRNFFLSLHIRDASELRVWGDAADYT